MYVSFYKYILVMVLFISINNTNAQGNSNSKVAKLVTKEPNKDELKLEEIDLGYKKIKTSTYIDLNLQNEEAKKMYEKLTTHSKLITKSQKEDLVFIESLKKYKVLNLTYNGKEIRFNSLFIKTIIENNKVHFISINSTEAFLYVDNDLNEILLSNELNNISLTPIIVKIF